MADIFKCCREAVEASSSPAPPMPTAAPGTLVTPRVATVFPRDPMVSCWYLLQPNFRLLSKASLTHHIYRLPGSVQ